MHYYRGTLSPAPNFAYELCVRKIAEADIEGLDLGSWRVALNGAEPVSSRTLERFIERFGRYNFRRETMMPVYGLAESTLAVTFSPLGRGPRVNRVERAAFEHEGLARAARQDDLNPIHFVSVGRPLPGHEVRIVDAAGQELGERREGHLWFRGPSSTPGYYHNPEATRQIAQQDGWVASGDRAYQAEGEIYITGRDKEIIIKAGRNIYAHEVEDITSQLEGVRKGSVVAFGVPDAKVGTEQLVVVAEIQDDVSRVARQQLAGAINQKLAEVLGLPPDVVELLPARTIPKTSSGKLRRSETRRLYLAGVLGARKPPAWWQLLRLAVAGLHDRRKVV
jgi:acyl-CoA synthetase (AMP-forming)/AMP-acid ligase II